MHVPCTYSRCPPTVQPWGGIVFKWPVQILRPVFMLVKYFRIEYTYKRIG